MTLLIRKQDQAEQADTPVSPSKALERIPKRSSENTSERVRNPYRAVIFALDVGVSDQIGFMRTTPFIQRECRSSTSARYVAKEKSAEALWVTITSALVVVK